MKKRIYVISLVLMICSLLVACQGDQKNSLPSSEKDTKITFTTSNLIYQNERSTSYSLGGIDAIYELSFDTLRKACWGRDY